MAQFKVFESFSKPIQNIISLSVVIMVGLNNLRDQVSYFKSPVWDGLTYDKIINLIKSDGYKSLSTIPFLDDSQIGASYAARYVYFQLIISFENLFHLERVVVYTAINFACATLSAYLLYLMGRKNFGISWITSTLMAVWFITSPQVLVIFQVIAHPELVMTTFILLGFFKYLNDKHYEAAMYLTLAVLAKGAAIAAVFYIIVSILLRKDMIRRKPLFLYGLAIVIPLTIISLTLSSRYKYSQETTDWIFSQVKPHLMPFILYNYNFLWLVLIYGFMFLGRSELKPFIAIVIIGAVMSYVDSVDWWRTWFSLTFFIVLPTVFRTIDLFVTEVNSKLVASLPVLLVFLYSINQNPVLNWEKVISPDWFPYLVTMAFLVYFFKSSRVKRAYSAKK
jgi:hypothetical protein